MSRQVSRLAAIALVAGLVVAAAGCSSTGGKKSEQNSGGVAGGKANTPNITIAMVTHGAPGDTFWDIIRKGAQAAAAKDNVTLKYSSDESSGNQANLIQSAIDSKVDGIAVTLPDPPALEPAVKKAIKDSGSKAKLGTFDFNPQIPPKIQAGDLQWAIDQQPYLQGYECVDSLWLYKANGNILGGGKPTLTGPFLVDKQNIEFVGK